MMKQTTTLTVFKKIIVVFGVCVIPSTGPVFAQSNNNQATTLLEIQALRQEVAELRDMVERQQYQMRQLKNDLETSASEPKSSSAAVNTANTLAPTPTQSNAVSSIINGNTTTGGSTASVAAAPNTVQTQPSLNYQSGTGRLSVSSNYSNGKWCD